MFRPDNMFVVLLGLLFLLSSSTRGATFIEDFSSGNANTTQWLEHSDTVRPEGKSKATLSIQVTPQFRRAVLFTLLNPQPCGAAFAGIKRHKNLDLTGFSHITLKVRGQGQYNGYEMFLKQATNNYSYCYFFAAPEDFAVIKVPIDGFEPYLEGKKVDINPTSRLDRTQIKSIGILAYGGLYLSKKQSGAASLEIDWIRLE